MMRLRPLSQVGAILSPVDLSNTKAVILSVEGLTLSDAERSLFREANPLGFILFGRNVEAPDQLLALTDELRDVVGRDCPVLIDQEGGRVARLQPPLWQGYPAAQSFGAMAEADFDKGMDALETRTMQIARELRASGINVDCDPVCDIALPETHDVIGDRAYSADPALVGRLAEHVCRTFVRAGVTPIIKHIPGHGRATADSHLELPIVGTSLDELRAVDFVPFAHIAKSDIAAKLWAMSAHILYKAIDEDVPLTLSKRGIDDIIRGEIGFDGVLVSDDVSMKALDAYGDLASLCVRSLEAGCDVALYCWAKMDEMESIVNSVPNLSPKAQKRLQIAAL